MYVITAIKVSDKAATSGRTESQEVSGWKDESSDGSGKLEGKVYKRVVTWRFASVACWLTHILTYSVSLVNGYQMRRKDADRIRLQRSVYQQQQQLPYEMSWSRTGTTVVYNIPSPCSSAHWSCARTLRRCPMHANRQFAPGRQSS